MVTFKGFLDAEIFESVELSLGDGLEVEGHLMVTFGVETHCGDC